MDPQSVVLFVTDDTAKTGYDCPMLLRNVLGVPMLSWLAESLTAGGCERFFLVCAEKYRETAAACFPAEVELIAPEDEISDRLHVFLSTAEEREDTVLVITRPVLRTQCGEGKTASGAFLIDRRAMMDALDIHESFQELCAAKGSPLTEREGFRAVRSGEELALLGTELARAKCAELSAAGVVIWDPTAVWIEPGVLVGEGTELLPGTLLRKGTVIGKNCVIGPNTLLEDTLVDDCARISASQLFHTRVEYDARIGPFACLRGESS